MLPDLPPELWHRIMVHTCTCTVDDNDNTDNHFNCTTILDLSRTCRELRQLSRYHRYHSVTIRGWENLFAFEERFRSTIGRPKGEGESDGLTELQDYEHDRFRDEEGAHSGIVHLTVVIGDLWSVAYPGGNGYDDGSGSETSDDTYVMSSDSDEDEGGEEGGKEGGSEQNDGHGSDIEPEGGGVSDEDEEENLVEEQALEFSPISDLEYAEVADDVAALRKEGRVGSLFGSRWDAQVLSYLLEDRPTAIACLEFRVYSALRRLLEACSPTLEALTLSWKPLRQFFVEAVLPVLPAVSVLRWDNDYAARPYFGAVMSPRKVPRPVIFPALQHLDIKKSSNYNMLKDVVSMSPAVRTVSIPESVIRRIALPCREKKVRVYVGSSWKGKMGRLDNQEAHRELGIWSMDNDYYAVPATEES